jgi:Domain of unknown function (DUF4091)/Family of unknown function (DUF6067)
MKKSILPLVISFICIFFLGCKTSESTIEASFVSNNTRFVQGQPFNAEKAITSKTNAWKGERVSLQLMLLSKSDVSKITVDCAPLKDAKGNQLENIKVRFEDFVKTDKYVPNCPAHKINEYDSSMVADKLDERTFSALKAGIVQPVWVTIEIPQTSQSGDYSGKITINGTQKQELSVEITVIDRTLPPASEWSFDLDLWQHPAAIARVHKVPLWSKAHYDVMKPYYQLLAKAGQKNITTSIISEPWGHQTFDDFPSLVKWTKKKDKTWAFDYTLFDEYVAFVMECGIQKRINCYTMIPWKLTFSYFDEALNQDTSVQLKTTSPEYKVFWKTMLVDFTKHLKEKGWFEKTSISVDERALVDMKIAIGILKEIDPKWKITLAGEYHPEIEMDVFDYSLASKFSFSEKSLQARKAKGMPSTVYTCCVEEFPNGFTFSPPAEHVWLGWFAASKGFTGYLRWAYNSWTANPAEDSRFTAWPGGDTYQIYPGPTSSIRFEKLIEGIQDFEKIQILKKAFTQEQKATELAQLESILKTFDLKTFNNEGTSEAVSMGQQFINKR